MLPPIEPILPAAPSRGMRQPLEARMALVLLALALLIALLPLRLAAAPMQLSSLSVPVNTLAPASASGEAVQFLGTGRIQAQLVPDPDSPTSVLLVTLDMTGVVATGATSRTRYVLRSLEAIVLPHAPIQSISVTFPMEPEPGSSSTGLRTGVVELTFNVDFVTGALTGLTSGRLRML